MNAGQDREHGIGLANRQSRVRREAGAFTDATADATPLVSTDIRADEPLPRFVSEQGRAAGAPFARKGETRQQPWPTSFAYAATATSARSTA